MLLREEKENVLLYIKQLSDDSMEISALDTPFFLFKFIRNDYSHV